MNWVLVRTPTGGIGNISGIVRILGKGYLNFAIIAESRSVYIQIAVSIQDSVSPPILSPITSPIEEKSKHTLQPLRNGSLFDLSPFCCNSIPFSPSLFNFVSNNSQPFYGCSASGARGIYENKTGPRKTNKRPCTKISTRGHDLGGETG
jgi:hypothetical protein